VCVCVLGGGQTGLPMSMDRGGLRETCLVQEHHITRMAFARACFYPFCHGDILGVGTVP
jgi:hypothetical protein